ncbi:YT521-B-like domain-containing protein [Bombardia bombarda]|uniref:YT521-B-like domain-containing protein n=1 Tax=Bombardia bombarda TaxID=252184 RepID=A0AA39X819_9PEZI|nr:YT521-B-like domain-containing protein [Bombardia bombarda]
MSSPSQAARLGLDARAAQLKERLLKSRSQSKARANSAAPANAANATAANAIAANAIAANANANAANANANASGLGLPRVVSSNGPFSNRSKPSAPQFVPHPIPRQPPQTSVPADANDIAALITSISSTSTTTSPTTDSATGHDSPIFSNGVVGKQESKPADIQTNLPQQTVASQPPTPSSVVSKPTATPTQRRYNEDQQSPQKPRTLGLPPTGPSDARAPPRSPREEGEIMTNDTRERDNQSGFARKTSFADKRAPNQPSSSTDHKAPASYHSTKKAKYVVPEEKPQLPANQPMPTSPTYHEPKNRHGPLPAPLRTASQVYKTAEPPKSVNGGGNSKVDKAPNLQGLPDHVSDTQKESPAPQVDALARALELDPDLKDWLVMTDYYDVEPRSRKLERHRKSKALAAEKERIEAEQRKLMEEEELELGLRRPMAAQVASAASSAAPTPTIPPVTTMSAATTEQNGMSGIVPAEAISSKRNRSEDADKVQDRPEKLSRVQEPSRSDASGNGLGEVDYRERDIEPASRHDLHSRPGSRHDLRSKPFELRLAPRDRSNSPRRYPYPVSPPQPPSRNDYRRSPPTRPREFSPHRTAYPQGPRFRPEADNTNYEDRFRAYDSYKAGGTSRRGSPPRDLRRRDAEQFSSVNRIDLGRKGDTRFFMVKSFNEDNVRKCMEDGVWATQTKNGPVLTGAFANCRHVILFFSINKSRAFQGYARMATAPSPDTPRPKWMSGIHWDTSPPFRVEWLSRTSVEFFRIGHLRNAYNEDLPVLVGKDGQEIEEECGRQLLYEMESYVEARNGSGSNDRYRAPLPPPSVPNRRDSGPGHGRGHGNGAGPGHSPSDPHPGSGSSPKKRFMKREEDQDN